MEANKKLNPSLPENYVTLLDLRARWMEQQKQKKREECDQDKELQRNVEVQDDRERVGAEGEEKGAQDDAQLEQQQTVEKSVVRSNPNPNSNQSTQRPFHGRGHPTETRNCRWVQVSQPKASHVATMVQPKRDPTIQGSQLKPAPVVQVAEQKVVPVLPACQSKPPSLEAPKVESTVKPRGEICGSDKKVDNRKFAKGKMEKKKKKVESAIESRGEIRDSDQNVDNQKLDGAKLEKEKVASAVEPRGEIRDSDKTGGNQKVDIAKMDKKKVGKRNKKRNQKEDVVKLQQVEGILALNGDPEEQENSKQGVVVGTGNNDVDDISAAEIEGKLADLSLNRRTGESSSARSMVIRNQRGWRKDGGYGKIEHSLKKGATRESGLVWVKKGEVSEMSAVREEKAGNMKV